MIMLVVHFSSESIPWNPHRSHWWQKLLNLFLWLQTWYSLNQSSEQAKRVSYIRNISPVFVDRPTLTCSASSRFSTAPDCCWTDNGRCWSASGGEQSDLHPATSYPLTSQILLFQHLHQRSFLKRLSSIEFRLTGKTVRSTKLTLASLISIQGHWLLKSRVSEAWFRGLSCHTDLSSLSGCPLKVLNESRMILVIFQLQFGVTLWETFRYIRCFFAYISSVAVASRASVINLYPLGCFHMPDSVKQKLCHLTDWMSLAV